MQSPVAEVESDGLRVGIGEDCSRRPLALECEASVVEVAGNLRRPEPDAERDQRRGGSYGREGR